ncbi:MAG: hypothetical protein FP816_11435 [Desulfobacteraceae bacterium]|nr:hypothetical protein [Desulfobacteraceae bacterium]MBU4056066.1 hypothetical protein [Pseudomonadota bacterium]
MKTQDRRAELKAIDEKTENLIAIGAAMGANCIPCFEHLYEKAITSGISIEEIKQTALIAAKVKKGANIILINTVNELLGVDETEDLPCDVGAGKTCTC